MKYVINYWKHVLSGFIVFAMFSLPLFLLHSNAEILMKIDGIDGESTVKGHEKWLNVDTIFFGTNRAVQTIPGKVDRETSDPALTEISVTRFFDSASPRLFIEAVAGKARDVQIDFIQSGGTDSPQQVYQTLKLDNVLLSSYNQSSGGERPSESISLNFTKITIESTRFEGKTATKLPTVSYDVINNKTGN